MVRNSQKRDTPFGVSLFWLNVDSNPFQCNCPVDSCSHQFKNRWLPLLSFANAKENANRIHRDNCVRYQLF